MKEGKSFCITKTEVLEAYKRVKANKGAGGIDGIELEEFERNWKNNLYKLWNRMSSGSYFPKAVRGVEIPKRDGNKRLLGIPTIEDRVAQMVLRNRIEPIVEPIFADDSYGYRPKKSALDAVTAARSRCFTMKWLIEFDVVGLFDNIDHAMLMEMLRTHIEEKWVLMYTERCLKSQLRMPDGTEKERLAGTPQGGVISPLLANLFMHYAFDKLIEREYPRNPWERYADDGVIHCVSEKQAQFIMDKLKERMRTFKLEIHPEKSKIVYCVRGDDDTGVHEHKAFDFLGYTFRARMIKNERGKYFRGFSPAVSKDAGKRFRNKIKEAIHATRTTDIIALAKQLNPIIRGWMNYFMKFNPSEAFRQGINFVNQTLVRWLERRRKRVKGSLRKAQALLYRIAKSSPELFHHWKMGYMPVI